MSDEKPHRKPCAVLETGLPPELRARLDRATDRKLNRFAPMKSTLIRRGIELALQEYESLTVRIAQELADARGLPADYAKVFYGADSDEGKIYAEATRIAAMLSGRND